MSNKPILCYGYNCPLRDRCRYYIKPLPEGVTPITRPTSGAFDIHGRVCGLYRPKFAEQQKKKACP